MRISLPLERARALVLLSVSFLLVALVACSSELAPGSNGTSADGGTPAVVGGVTFNHDIAPIVEKSCVGCHSKGGIAPFSLATFSDAKPMAGAMIAAVKERRMPPWSARVDATCTPPASYQHDPSLSEADIAKIEKWKADGLQEGDPKEARPLVGATSGLANPSAELAANMPFSVSGERDLFRCFVLDPKLSAQTFLSGFHVIPGSSQVVHHAILYSDPKGQSVGLAGQQGSYECFGGARVGQSEILGVWAPGARAMEYAEGAAAQLAAGTKLVLQVHYHPKPGATIPDQTKVQLRYSETIPRYLAINQLIGNFTGSSPGSELVKQPDESSPKFLIPAGASNHVEEMLFTVPNGIGQVYLASIGGHAHLLGKDILITSKSSGVDQCLLHIPSWDFNWQRAYTFDRPIEQLPLVKSGDQLRLKCTYDNTLGNKALATELASRGGSLQDVNLGEETMDEMCLAFITVYKGL